LGESGFPRSKIGEGLAVLLSDLVDPGEERI
jgi:hypothetical protein